MDQIGETTFLAISAILFEIEIEEYVMKRAGIDPGSAILPYIRSIFLIYTTMLCKGKEKLMAATHSDGSTRSNLTFAFQNCRVKFAQHFSGSYAFIQVFCFCSTNFTWFNNIIKYKNLSANKYVWFNKTFSFT